MNRPDVELGDKVRDTITGYTGTAIAITEWLNGCKRVNVQASMGKDGKVPDSYTFDIEQIVVLEAKRPRKDSRTLLRAAGGPHDEPSRNADPRR